MSIIRKPFRFMHFNTVYWLIGINLLFYIVLSFFGDTVVSSLDVTDILEKRYGQIYDEVKVPMSLNNMLAMLPQAVIKKGTVWSFVTYMFMHGGLTHILFNMFGLFIFGIHVERQMGSKEFLLFYLITGALAGVLSFIIYVLSGMMLVNLVGASGALYAVMLAYAVMYPSSIIYIWGIIPLRAPVMVLGYTVLSLFFIVTGGGGNVAHATHLAGFILAWLYFMIRFGISPWRRLTGR
ncbi:MAG: rhomboid family intramembrane serine protease [Treponema sp.]|nr:rhomboid family intramembrane serine protease [Treponema sp.]